MKRYLVALLTLASIAVAVRAYAHHSFAATYREDTSITIQGELVQVLFRNPHSFMHVMVKEKDGSVVRYAVEWSGAEQLVHNGVTRETLKPGDLVIISGSPGHDLADHRVRMVGLSRPRDGFRWSEPLAGQMD